MYPAKVKIESMEEYSEANTSKSKPELRNSKCKGIVTANPGVCLQLPRINGNASADVG